MSDTEEHPAEPTVRSRLWAFLSEERITAHLEREVIKLDGVVITDLDQAAPEGTHLVLGGS